MTNWMVVSGRPDEALAWGDLAVGNTDPDSALRAMARTAQAYALAAAGRSPEGLAYSAFSRCQETKSRRRKPMPSSCGAC